MILLKIWDMIEERGEKSEEIWDRREGREEREKMRDEKVNKRYEIKDNI